MTEEADLIAGRYRLGAEVGSGGMGVVWRARDEVLGRTVALKALTVRNFADGSRDDESARRAMREARIAARLHHPNVIGVYDVVEHDGRPFLIMEYLASRSLSEMMAAEELLAPPETARIGALLAAALRAAHKAGVVHRDVKPGNVLLAQDGTVKLTDFGISRAIGDTTVTGSGILLGTLAYIAPEVGRGQPSDSRSDVYSLGATLYAAIEGKPPFGIDDNAIALLYRIVHEDIIPPRNAGPLEPVLLWMLERDPELRPTLPQVQRALEAIEAANDEPAAEEVEVATPATPPAPPADEPPSPAPSASVSASAPTPTPTPLPSTPASTPTPTPTPPAEPQDDAGSKPPSSGPFIKKRRALTAALLAAIVVVVAVVVLTERTADNAAANTPSSSGSHSATATHTSAPPTRSAGANASASANAGGAPPATTMPPSTPTTSSAPPQDRATQLRSTIIDYYQLMPGNLAEGWPWMTADYQTNTAGGLSGYQKFWSQIQRVTVSDVTATLPATVNATIDYYYKNGSIIEDRTSFGMVFEQGRWKIASSHVSSSVQK